jgi:uncharacterized RDD family membrane protein YckC
MSQRAGWYDDPENSDNLRYFDGVVWTTHTTTKAPVVPTAPRVPTVPTVPTVQVSTPGAGWGQQQPQQYGQQPQQYGKQPQQYGQQPQQYGQQQDGQPAYSSAPVYGAALGLKTTPDGQPLASYGQRVGAWVLDALILLVVVGLLASYWIGQLVRWYVTFLDGVMNDAAAGGTPTFDQASITAEITGYVLPISLITFVVTVLYQVVFLTLKGATPGKMAVGISVRLRSRPGTLTLLDAVKRQGVYVATSALYLVPLVGFISMFVKLLDVLWPLWDDNRQALHDKIAGTNVVVRPHKR